MKKIKYPSPINLKDFAKDKKDLKALYGLPKKTIFCKKCVISNQRPNSAVEYEHTRESVKETINFNDAGICDACIFAEKKQNLINWEDRERQLIELCNQHR